MKFYMTPGSCSTGIHILLETLELPFEAWILNLPAGDHLKPEYLAINPRGTFPMPMLADAGAGRGPGAHRLPLDLALGQLHGEGFRRIFTAERYLAEPDVRAREAALEQPYAVFHRCPAFQAGAMPSPIATKPTGLCRKPANCWRGGEFWRECAVVTQ